MEHISNLILVKWKVSKWGLNVINRQTDEKVVTFHHLHVKVNIISSTDREMQKVLIFHDSLTPPIIGRTHIKPHLDGRGKSEDKMWQTNRQMQNVIIFRHSQISEDNLCQTDRPIQKVIYRKKQWFFFVTHKHRAYASALLYIESSSKWEWLSSNGHASSVSLPEPGRSAGPSDEFRDTDYSSPSSPLRVCTLYPPTTPQVLPWLSSFTSVFFPLHHHPPLTSFSCHHHISWSFYRNAILRMDTIKWP